MSIARSFIGDRCTIRLSDGTAQRVTIIDYYKLYVAVRRWPWSQHFWVSIANVEPA